MVVLKKKQNKGDVSKSSLKRRERERRRRKRWWWKKKHEKISWSCSQGTNRSREGRGREGKRERERKATFSSLWRLFPSFPSLHLKLIFENTLGYRQTEKSS